MVMPPVPTEIVTEVPASAAVPALGLWLTTLPLLASMEGTWSTTTVKPALRRV